MRETRHGIIPGSVQIIHVCTDDFELIVTDETQNLIEVTVYEYELGELSPVKIAANLLGNPVAGAEKIPSIVDEPEYEVWTLTSATHVNEDLLEDTKDLFSEILGVSSLDDEAELESALSSSSDPEEDIEDMYDSTDDSEDEDDEDDE